MKTLTVALLVCLIATPAFASGVPPHCKSVLEFGAVGDGVHDDTDAIQAAIDAGDVYLPPSDTGGERYYRTTRTLVLREGVTIVGKPLFSQIRTEAEIGMICWSTEKEAWWGRSLGPYAGQVPNKGYKGHETSIWIPGPRGWADHGLTYQNFMCRGVHLYGIRIEGPVGAWGGAGPRPPRIGFTNMGLHTSMLNFEQCYFVGREAGMVLGGFVFGSTFRSCYFHPTLELLFTDGQDLLNSSSFEDLHIGLGHNIGDDWGLIMKGAMQAISFRGITMQGRKRGVLVDIDHAGVTVSIDGVYDYDPCDLDGVNPVGSETYKYKYGPSVYVKAVSQLSLKNVLAWRPVIIGPRAGSVTLENIQPPVDDNRDPKAGPPVDYGRIRIVGEPGEPLSLPQE